MPGRSARVAAALGLIVAMALLLGAACTADAPPPSAAGTTIGTGVGRGPGTVAIPDPPGTTSPSTTPPATDAPGTTTTASTAPPAPTTTVPPAGTPLPGGPVRPARVDTMLTGPCPETVGRVEQLTFQSNVLAIDQPVQRYRVYTPACYRYGTVRYPTLYLFHGAQADESQWDDVGVFATADRLIAAGAIPPMIIVLPDGIWAMGSYVYTPSLFERFLLGEVMPAIEQDLRTVADRRFRGLGGISRGGEWSLLAGARHPDLFGTVEGNSPAVGPPGSPVSLLVPLFQRNAGQRLRLDVGESDSLVGPVTELHRALEAARVPHEFLASPGGHDRAYWGAQTEAYLRFFGAGIPR